tara:strand:+ start:752 stop:1804 length:1053 start_codon:yes stop_codon:yes gene_type:complete
MQSINLNNKAAILNKIKKPLNIKKIFVPRLNENLVLVKMKYSYVCGSQINEWQGKKGKDNYLPHTLGHEGCGEIVAVGKKVKKFKKGNKVLVSWIKNQTKCSFQKFNYFDNKKNLINTGPVSTFLKYSIVPIDRIYKLNNHLYNKTSALFGCAMPTGVGMVMKILKKIKKKDHIVIFGVGGIGTIALATLLYFKFKNVIVVDKDRNKLKLCKKMGALESLKLEDFLEKINKKKILKENIGATIECSGNVKLIENAFKNLKKDGVCVVGGNVKFGTKLKIDPYEIIFGKQILGTIGGDLQINKNLQLFNKIVQSNPVMKKSFLKYQYNLNNINKAFNDLKKGKVLRPLIKL